VSIPANRDAAAAWVRTRGRRRRAGATAAPEGFADDFGGTAGDTIGSASISAAWTLHDQFLIEEADGPAHDTVETVNGRLKLHNVDNIGYDTNYGKSLIWRDGGRDYLGAIHYKLMIPPFSVAAIGCLIAEHDDPGTFITQVGEYILCGIHMRNPDMSPEYEHCVLGYRAGVETLEWKRRAGATEIQVGDVGAFTSGEPTGDVRVDVAVGGARTWYYRETVGSGAWTEMTSGWGGASDPDLFDGDGAVAVGICAYAFDDFVPEFAAYIDRTEVDPV
jgi:hypothetical protein